MCVCGSGDFLMLKGNWRFFLGTLEDSGQLRLYKECVSTATVLGKSHPLKDLLVVIFTSLLMYPE